MVKDNSRKTLSDFVKAEVDTLPPETDESQALFELEVARLNVEKLTLENQKLREGVEDSQADRKLRKKYADNAFRFLVIFSIFCCLAILAQGTPSCPFKLESEVLITLIGSTAASVIGLVGWVARGLFKAPEIT